MGTVSDESGHGIPDARVRTLLVDAPENQFNGPFVDTDPAGAIPLCSRPGRLRLRIDAEGYGSVKLSAAAGRDRPRIDVRLTPEAVIQGRTVRRETGAPIPHVQLLLDETSAPADARSLGRRGDHHFRPRGARSRCGAGSQGNTGSGPTRRTRWGVKTAWSSAGGRGQTRRGPTAGYDLGGRCAGARPGPTSVRRGPQSGLVGTEDSSYGVISQPDGRVTIHGVFPRTRISLTCWTTAMAGCPTTWCRPRSLNVVTPRVRDVVLTLAPASTWEKP